MNRQQALNQLINLRDQYAAELDEIYSRRLKNNPKELIALGIGLTTDGMRDKAFDSLGRGDQMTLVAAAVIDIILRLEHAKEML